MWKVFFIYPIVLFTMIWLASDVDIGASLRSLDDNYLAIEFPKESLRPANTPEPWYRFYWNVEYMQDELQQINDAVVK